MLSLCCCTRGFSSCPERGLLSRHGVQASLCSSFSCVEHEFSGEWASAVVVPGYRAQTQQLWCVGLAASRTAASSRTRDWTHFSCIDRVPSLDQEDSLEQNMATHSSVLAWRIPWTGKPGGLQTMGSQRVRHDWARKPDTVSVAADGIVSFF